MKIAAILVLVAWWAVPAVAQQPGAADAQTPGTQTPDMQISTPDDGSTSSKAFEEADQKMMHGMAVADGRRRGPRFRCWDDRRITRVPSTWRRLSFNTAKIPKSGTWRRTLFSPRPGRSRR